MRERSTLGRGDIAQGTAEVETPRTVAAIHLTTVTKSAADNQPAEGSDEA